MGRVKEKVSFAFGLTSQKDDPVRGTREGMVFSTLRVEDGIRQFLLLHKEEFSNENRIVFSVAPSQIFDGNKFEPSCDVVLSSTNGLTEDLCRKFFDFLSLLLGRTNPQWNW